MFREELLTVGEAFEDLIFFDLARLPGPGEEVKTSTFLRTYGGGAVITAVAAARLGLQSRIVSGLSPAAAAFLRAEKVKVRNLRRPGEPYAISAALSTRGNRSFVTFNGINDLLEERLFEPVRLSSARHVHLAFYPHQCGRWESIVDGLCRRGISSSWDFGWNEGLLGDPGFRPLLRALDYLFINEQEAILYSGKRSMPAALEFWQALGKNVVIKQGERGSEWLTPTKRLREPAPRVRVVDTTGAGDAFNGGFLYGALKGLPARKCLRIANRVGALSTRSAGGIDGLPRKGEFTFAASKTAKTRYKTGAL
jgi:sugar/nucleoside kinase (ribokinase family)